MAKKVEIKQVEALLKALSDRTKQSLDYHGFGVMSDKINGSITQKYLYESLFKGAERARKKDATHVNLSLNKLDEVTQYLNFEGFDHFARSLENHADPMLLACVGAYYSFVRRSSAKGVVLQSPVKIYEEDQKVWLELKGPAQLYKGELSLLHGCLFCLMASAEGKVFHHVYRIGIRKRPQVLTGVFSGISTASHPLGGRAVLIRQAAYDKLENKAVEIAQLQASPEISQRRLGQFFETFEENNLQVNIPITFDLDALGDCD